MKARLKTTRNENSVEEFVQSVADEGKRSDSHTLISIMQRITGEEPCMWGPGIIGFGSCHYKYESGREGDQQFSIWTNVPKKSARLYKKVFLIIVQIENCS